MVSGDGKAFSEMSEVELLDLIAALTQELRGRHTGNDTVTWTELDRKIASGVTLPPRRGRGK